MKFEKKVLTALVTSAIGSLVAGHASAFTWSANWSNPMTGSANFTSNQISDLDGCAAQVGIGNDCFVSETVTNSYSNSIGERTLQYDMSAGTLYAMGQNTDKSGSVATIRTVQHDVNSVTTDTGTYTVTSINTSSNYGAEFDFSLTELSGQVWREDDFVDPTSGFSFTPDQASIYNINTAGETHGLFIGTSSTTLSGGTNSTTAVLNDSGVHITDTTNGTTFNLDNAGNASIREDLTVGSDLMVQRDTTLMGTLDVEGATTLDNTLWVTGFADLQSGLEVQGHTDLDGTLSVRNDATFRDNLTVMDDASVQDNLWVGSNLDVQGSATVDSHLTVSADATMRNDLYVGSALIVEADSTFRDDLYVGSNLTVGSDLNVGGGAYVGQELIVELDSTFRDDLYVGSSLIVETDSTFRDDLYVGSNLTVGSDLNVGGGGYVGQELIVELDSTFRDDLYVGSSLIVETDSTFRDDLYVGSNLTVGSDLNVGGGAYVGQELTVEWDSTFRDDLYVGSSLLVEADSTFRDDLSVGSNLDVQGSATIDSHLTVSADATMRNDLWVGSDLDVQGGLEVQGHTDLDGTLSVRHDATFRDNLTVMDNATVQDNLWVGQHLDVMGGSYIQSANTINDVMDYDATYYDYVTRDVNGTIVDSGEGPGNPTWQINIVPNWYGDETQWSSQSGRYGFIAGTTHEVTDDYAMTWHGDSEIDERSYDFTYLERYPVMEGGIVIAETIQVVGQGEEDYSSLHDASHTVGDMYGEGNTVTSEVNNYDANWIWQDFTSTDDGYHRQYESDHSMGGYSFHELGEGYVITEVADVNMDFESNLIEVDGVWVEDPDLPNYDNSTGSTGLSGVLPNEAFMAVSDLATGNVGYVAIENESDGEGGYTGNTTVEVGVDTADSSSGLVVGGGMTELGVESANGMSGIRSTDGMTEVGVEMANGDWNGMVSDGYGNFVGSWDASRDVSNGMFTDNWGTYVTGNTELVMSGGTGTTTLTLNDSGATFSDGEGGPAVVTGVAAGSSTYDAVNYGQFNDFQEDMTSQFNSFKRQTNRRINDVEDTAYGGIAAAVALTSTQMPSAPGKTSVNVGYGYYEGESGYGVNVVHALEAAADYNGTLNLGVAGNTGGGGAIIRAGGGFEF